MRRGIGIIPFLLAIRVFPAPADQLPAYCGGVGAKSYTPPAVAIPPVVLNRGTVITVTNATVVVNGDTSSVKALVANPCPDGISIQQAIMATNNDPGTWVIQFAPALKGSTIVVDTPPSGGLSPLTGGNVTINNCCGFKAPPSCHRAAQLWQLVKMPVPRDESQIVFYRHCGDPQIVIRHRRTGAFELHE